MDNPIIIFGTGGLSRAALEILASNGCIVYGFLDDNKKLHHTDIDNIPVLGKTDDPDFLKLIGKKCEAFIATDDNEEKRSLAHLLIDQCKVMPINAVHTSAYVASSATIGHGNFLNTGVVLGAGVSLANHCLLHAGSVIDHEAQIEDFVQVSTGATVGARVKLGQNVFVGTGSVLVAGVKIGKNARIGAGSVVTADVPEGVTVFGNPANAIKAP